MSVHGRTNTNCVLQWTETFKASLRILKKTVSRTSLVDHSVNQCPPQPLPKLGAVKVDAVWKEELAREGQKMPLKLLLRPGPMQHSHVARQCHVAKQCGRSRPFLLNAMSFTQTTKSVCLTSWLSLFYVPARRT